MSMERPRILVAEPLNEGAMERLASVGEIVVPASCGEADLIAAIGDCDAVVVRSAAQITATVLDAAPRLKVVGRAGVGLDHIDLEAAKARGVQVVHTPHAPTVSTAELTVGLMLALERRLVLADAMVRDQRFAEARRELIGRELRGLTLGVVGMGRIGTTVARICHDGLGMRIRYNDIREIGPLPFDAESTTKEMLYAESDVVTLHVPLTELTRGMIDAAALRRFKSTATLVNTSRGPVVRADALADALQSGSLAGAALDVHDPEPPGRDHPLMVLPNVLLSAHLGSRTHTSLAAMSTVVDDVLAVLEGRRPAYPA